MLVAQNLKIGVGDPSVSPYEFTGPLASGRFPNLASVVNNAVPIFFAISGIALFVYLVWGGFDFLLSMGDAKKAEQGKNRITHAVVGFIIIFVSYWVLQLADLFLGFKIF